MAEAKTATKKYYLGTGRRKTAVARVRLSEGSGQIAINGRPLNEYFTELKDRQAVLGPLVLAEMTNRLDVAVTVEGGGFTGQAGAICQGLARALKNMFGLPSGATPSSRRRWKSKASRPPGGGPKSKRFSRRSSPLIRLVRS